MKIAQLVIELDKKAVKDNAKLRGFFANNFTEVDFFHNHTSKGKDIYRYPRIQYRFYEGKPSLFAFNEGVEILKEYYDKFDSIKIGTQIFIITEKFLKFENCEIEETQDFIKYQFVSPWYPLNQINHKLYSKLKLNKERDEFLSNILISNILRMCKEMGYRINKKIEIQLFVSQKKSPVKIKNYEAIVFDGFFKTNIYMPDYIGLGKSVSKGFGCIKRME
jgi:hypothetical protein